MPQTGAEGPQVGKAFKRVKYTQTLERVSAKLAKLAKRTVRRRGKIEVVLREEAPKPWRDNPPTSSAQSQREIHYQHRTQKSN